MAKQARLKVAIDGDSTGLQRSLNKAESRVGRFSKKMKKAMAGIGLGVAGAGTAGATLGLSMFTRKLGEAADFYDKIGKAATRHRVSTTFLQRVGKQADLAGTSLDAVGRSMTFLVKSTREAQRSPRGSIAQSFADLNIEVEHFARLAPDQKLLKVADAFRKASDRQEAFAAVLKIMGRSADEMVPLLETLQNFGPGTILTPAQVRQIEAYNDELAKMNHELRALAGATIPVLTDKLKKLNIGLWAAGLTPMGKKFKDFLGIKEPGAEKAPPMAPVKQVVGNASSGNFSGLDAFIDMQRRRHGDMRFARGGRFKAQRHFFNERDPVFGPRGGGIDPTLRFREPLDIFKNSGPLVTGEGGPLAGAGMPVHPNSKLGRQIRAGIKPAGSRRPGVQGATGGMGAQGGLSGPTAFKSIRRQMEIDAQRKREQEEKKNDPITLLEEISLASQQTADHTRPE